MSDATGKETNRYKQLIEQIFFERYTKGATEIEWARDDLETAASGLGIALPKNLGDVVYAQRYRAPMPASIIATQPDGMEWIIEGAGRARYKFSLVKLNRIVPNQALVTASIPNSTPELISHYALDDEQALLAIVRYNRLIDILDSRTKCNAV